MTIDPMQMWNAGEAGKAADGLASFPSAAVVQVIAGDPMFADAVVTELHPAHVVVTDQRVVATVGGGDDWSWGVSDLEAVIHSADSSWSILVVPGVSDFGVSVPAGNVDAFRRVIALLPGVSVLQQGPVATPPARSYDPGLAVPLVAPSSPAESLLVLDVVTTQVLVVDEAMWASASVMGPPIEAPIVTGATDAGTTATADVRIDATPQAMSQPASGTQVHAAPALSGPKRMQRMSLRGRPLATTIADIVPTDTALAGIDARNISAWFGSHMVLDRVSLDMQAGNVTALIGPSGCGKSTFLRILNRMHEMIPSAAMGGEVLIDGHDIYDPERKITDARREVGMVFQKPNPFPAMSIYDNVLASLRLTGVKATTSLKDEIVESCLTKGGLWNEVKDRLRQPGGGLSGGQQQRLCIARALAIKPRVLLMDEPCSALDPTSTRRIEETIGQIVSEVTIVIVTHNMQQAARVSNHCAFFLAAQGTPGVIVEHGPTEAMFSSPQDPRTSDYVMGRFG